MDITVTSILRAISINIDGETKYYGAGELHPSTPEGTGNTVFIYSTTAIFDFDRDKITAVVGTDTINVNGVTSFADASALVAALAQLFFSIDSDIDSIQHKFGFNNDVDTGAAEVLASFGGALNPTTWVQTSDQTITITYTPASDGATATGARSLLITVVRDIGGVLSSVNEVHVLGSSGSDVTSFTARGINRVVVLSNGGVGWNVADINLSIGGTTQARLPATKGVTQQLIFHTRQNYRYEVKGFELNCLRLAGGADPVVSFTIYSWSRVTLTRYQVFNRRIDTAINNDYSVNFGDSPFLIGGREVFYIEVSTDQNNTIVNGRIYGKEKIAA